LGGQTLLDDFSEVAESEGLAQIEFASIHENVSNTIHLNSAQLEELKSSGLFTTQQIQAIIKHRKKFGSFLCIEEFQQLTCFTKSEIQKLSRSLIIEPLVKDLNFKLTQSKISFRHSRVFEKSRAYDQNIYNGSPDYMLIKYQGKKHGIYDIGFHFEKDSGEKLIDNQKPYLLLDHQRFYLNYYKQLGPIRQIVLGDFNINMGQGLISLSQFRIGSGSSISNLISTSESINKFSGLDENRFLRGLAIKMKLSKAINISSFLSKKPYDALLLVDETTMKETISSLQLTGNHRTETEISRKNNVSALTFGCSINLDFKNIRLGMNQHINKFDRAVQLNSLAFRPRGLTQNTTLYSFDYRVSRNNIIGFGEWAFNGEFNHALIVGLIIALDPGLELALTYRDYSPSYSSFFSAAIGQSSTNQNERGISFKVNYTLNKYWTLHLNHDSWLHMKSRIGILGSAISSENIFKLSYSKKKFLSASLLLRFRDGAKPSKSKLIKSLSYKRRSWRLHFNLIPLNGFEFRSRIEFNAYNFEGQTEEGVLSYQEIVYHVLQHKIKARIRLTLFETASYESRIYAYEQTVPGFYAIPSFSGSGYKLQLIIGLKLVNNLNIDFGYTRISYYDRNEIGSGFDRITGSEKTQVQTQLAYRF